MLIVSASTGPTAEPHPAEPMEQWLKADGGKKRVLTVRRDLYLCHGGDENETRFRV